MRLRPIHLLQVEDNADDALLVRRELERAGHEIVVHLVDTESEMRGSLEAARWDVVITDYSLPGFDARKAIEIVREFDPDLPVIVVSGVMSEQTVVETMRLGANEYVMKDNLQRLAPAVERELRDAEARRRARRLEHEVRERERLLAQGERLAHAGSWAWDVRAENVRWSDEVFRIFGVGPPAREVPLERFFSLVHPEDRAFVEGAVSRCLEGEPYHISFRIVRPEGEIRLLEARGEIESDENGDPTRMYGVVLDVTERERVKADLVASERKFRELIEAANEGIWTVGLDGRTTFVNRRLAAMLGYSVDEMIGRHFTEFRNPEWREIAGGTFPQGDLALRQDVKLRTRGGGEVWALMSVTPLRDASGAHAGSLAMVTDITERKLAEEALRKSEASLARAQRIARLGDWMCDLDTGAVEISPATRELLGLPEGSIALDEMIAMFNPEDRPRVLQGLNDALNDVQYQAEMRLVTAHGELTVLLAGEAQRDPTGLPRRILGTVQDITERRRIEADRSRLEQELALVLESTLDGMVAVDTRGYCTLVNSAASVLTGYAPEDLIGRRFAEALPQLRADGTWRSPEECPVEQVLATGQPLSLPDLVFWRHDGTWTSIDVGVSPILEEGTIRGAVLSMRDVTQRNLMQEELERAHRLTSLGRVAASITHEFNNVLMGIQPFAEIVARQTMQPQIGEAAEHIRRALQRGRRITHEILRFTRPAEPLREPILLASLLEGFAAEIRPILPPSVDLALAIPDRDIVIQGDREQLLQILSNLAINARDAMSSTGGTLTIDARRCLSGEAYEFGVVQTSDRFAHLAVRDEGGGIPADLRDQIFDPFFTTKKNGTGLGLAIAHQVVKLHGGHIFVESEKGRGTAFHLFLPLSDATVVAGPALVPERAARYVNAAPRALSLLLVDDDESILAGTSAVLELEGVHVRTAGSGAAALAALEAEIPDAVILDLGLPDTTGDRLYLQFAERYPALPVVFSSGDADAAKLEEYTRRPHVTSLTKPYAIDDLMAAVESVVHVKGRRGE